jgi:hypothetical protein
MSQKTSHTTTNHDEIRKWVEEREGSPARIRNTGGKKDAGLLRINFPGGNEDNLENISWEGFFKKFESEKLAFLYQDKKSDGEISYFNKLVAR